MSEVSGTRTTHFLSGDPTLREQRDQGWLSSALEIILVGQGISTAISRWNYSIHVAHITYRITCSHTFTEISRGRSVNKQVSSSSSVHSPHLISIAPFKANIRGDAKTTAAAAFVLQVASGNRNELHLQDSRALARNREAVITLISSVSRKGCPGQGDGGEQIFLFANVGARVLH